MTALPPHLDELVSAYLDGAAAPDEIELVENDRALLERVEELRTLRGRFGEVPVAAEQRELHLGAALDLFDQLQLDESAAASPRAVPSATDASPPDTTALDSRAPGAHPQRAETAPPGSSPAQDGVASLDERRRRRGLADRSRLLIGAAAAAMVLVAGVAITQNRSADRTDVATEAVADAVDASGDDSAGARIELDDPGLETAMIDLDAVEEAAEDDAMDEEAMDEEEVMEDAPMAESADAMADEDDAMEEVEPSADEDDGANTADDAGENAGAAAAVPNPTITPLEFDAETLESRAFFRVEGEFESAERLSIALDGRGFIEPEVFDFVNCQPLVEELQGADPTLMGIGIVDGEEVEVHRLPGTNARLIVRVPTCEIIEILE